MQLSVTGHHIDITESLRNYVGTKLAKIERHFDHMTDIHCVLTVEKLQHKAEATIHVGGARSTPSRSSPTCTPPSTSSSTSSIGRSRNIKRSSTDHHAREVARYR